MQAPMAFMDAEFTLNLRTIGSTWKKHPKLLKPYPLSLVADLQPYGGHYWYVAANTKSFLLRSTSQRLCSLKSAPANVPCMPTLGAISVTPLPNNRPGHPFKLESFTFSPQCKPRCKQRIVETRSNLLIQITISSCVVKYHSKAISLGEAEGSYSNSWH